MIGAQKIGAKTRIAAVVGWPVEHSRSPDLHNAAFAAAGIDAAFAAFAVEPGRASEAISGMSALGFMGASVTVPHKLDALKACDRLDESARRVGAVNCLCFESGQIIGHNTDAGGFVDALAEKTKLDLPGRRVVLLGGGGAARAVWAGLSAAGVGSVEAIVRTPSKVDWLEAKAWTAKELARSLQSCDLLVDCTSMGLDPEREAQIPAAVPLERLGPDAVVATLVYHRKTQLLDAAEARGLRCVDGVGMLVHQGARAFRLWTGVDAPLAAMWEAMLRPKTE